MLPFPRILLLFPIFFRFGRFSVPIFHYEEPIRKRPDFSRAISSRGITPLRILLRAMRCVAQLTADLSRVGGSRIYPFFNDPLRIFFHDPQGDLAPPPRAGSFSLSMAYPPHPPPPPPRKSPHPHPCASFAPGSFAFSAFLPRSSVGMYPFDFGSSHLLEIKVDASTSSCPLRFLFAF